MRVAVLLGAGASFDAGLKTTYGLARDLVERINSGEMATGRDVKAALNFVYSEMVAHLGRHGANPLDAVNTERLISAVRLLAARDEHEADPFVASWKTAPGIISTNLSAGTRALRRVLNRGDLTSDGTIDAGELAHAIKRIATDTNEDVFVDLERALLATISSVLAGHGDVSYLHPLIQLAHSQEGVDIATLNYDLTIETAAQDLSVPVDRGVERWTPGSPMTFTSERGKVNLFKLHGSLDWEHISAQEQRSEWRDAHGTEHFPVVVGRSVRVSETGPVSRPAIIIGDREKLNGEGPTLSLISGFEAALSRSTHLVVVGYSFTDVHVNALVRSWANADVERTLSVVDPAWPDRYRIGGFRAHLVNALRPWRHTAAGVKPRMDVIRTGAKDALPTALAGLRPRSAVPVSVRCVETEGGVQLHVINSHLHVTAVSVVAPSPSYENPGAEHVGLRDADGEFSIVLNVGEMKPDEVFVTDMESALSPGALFTVQLQVMDHQDEWEYEAPLHWPARPEARSDRGRSG